MKSIIKTYSKKLISFVLILCMIIPLFPSQAFALGDDDNAYRIHNSSIIYYSDFKAAWDDASDGDTVGILKDRELPGYCLVLSSGSVTLELNGHKLFRRNNTDHNDGEIIQVKNGAELKVYGGRQNWSIKDGTVTLPKDAEDKIDGKYYDINGFASVFGTPAKNTVWHLCYFDYDTRKINYANEKEEYAVSGGLINGGWSSSNGGAIRMMGNGAEVELYDVTVAGNIAKDSGGAIAMYNDYQKLRLIDSRIMFNNADGHNGGGIYVDGKYSKIYLTRSHIDYNLARDNGGGIYINKENAVVAGDAVRVDPADENYPANWENETFTTHPYIALNADHNPFWNRVDNNDSKHVGTDKKLSTLAYNIVFNSDTDGGGGAIYTDGDNTAIGGLNIMKNLALGFGLNATWCGRGAGVYFNSEGNTLANSNVWHNWSRSEGGGVMDDNDSCALTDVTVTENYADTSGWSGGGVYVLGTVNLSLGGQCVIKDNTSYGKSRDDLYLGFFNAMYARLELSVEKGSEIWTWISGTATSITKTPGVYDERMFFSDENGYHVEYKDQILSLVKGKSSKDYIRDKYPEIPVKELVPDDPITKGSRTRKLDKTYTSGNGRTYDIYQGVIRMPAFMDSSKDLYSTYFFSEGYFDGDPKVYNTHLATMSLHLACAAFYSNDGNEGAVLYDEDGNGSYYPVKSNNVRQFFSDLGVKEEDIFLNDFNIEKPDSDTIGVAIGSRTINVGGKKKTLVIIGVRGSGYEKEWVSNVTLGSEGEAKGFGSAADQVFAELKNYLERKGIEGSSEDTVFWVAGFSRAGATSNLTGVRIVDNFDTMGTHTFVYTFEAPKGGMSTVRENTEKYFCIHNIVNKGDIVPEVGPSAMGFHRYGVDHYIPGSPDSGTPGSEQGSYKVMGENGTGSEVKTYTTWHDNKVYSVGSSEYNAQKNKMLKQLKLLVGYDLIYSDYFHAATISYLGGAIFGSFGWKMIDEDSDMLTNIPEDKRNAAAFNKYFLDDLQKKVMNFVADRNGTRIDGLYRLSYSKTMLGDMPIEQAAAEAAGIVYSLTPEQMAGLSELAGTIMERIDVTDIYLGYLQANVAFDKMVAVYNDSPALYPFTLVMSPSSTVGALSMAFGKQKSAGQLINEIWNELNAPTMEQLQNEAVEDKYREDRAKGYMFLQDVLTDEQIETLGRSIPVVGFMLLEYLKLDYDETGNDMLGTMVYNAGRIIQNHYPEVVLAWMRSYDSYYDEENTAVVIAESAKVSKVYPPMANGVEADGISVTYDEPEVSLSVRGDVDCGAAIYYRFTSGNKEDTKLHPYTGPILLKADENRDVNYTLETFAIHDGIKSASRKIDITVLEKGAETDEDDTEDTGSILPEETMELNDIISEEMIEEIFDWMDGEDTEN